MNPWAVAVLVLVLVVVLAFALRRTAVVGSAEDLADPLRMVRY